jgi:5'-deoxynucleotidase YfbR-like HD superfamily hydrolase
MQTADGGAFFFEHPEPAHITVENIARGLATMTRFNGAFRERGMDYTVAEHAVRCYWLARRMYPDVPRLWDWALHHDDEESVTGDILPQIKQLVPEVRTKIIEPARAAFTLAMGLWPVIEPPEIKDIDNIMCSTERRDLLADKELWVPADWQELSEPDGLQKITGKWTSTHAEIMYLDSHHEIKNEIYREEKAHAAASR